MPLVYIILVNYNGYKDTLDCMESLKKIKYENYKIIIVDNASNDDSVFILKKKFEDCLIIESKVNLGFAGGNNLGIKYALDNNADYILLLNNDTTVEPDFLNRLVEISESDDKIGIVGGKICYHSNPNIIWYAGGKINNFTGSTKHIGVNEIDNEKYSDIFETQYVTGCLMLVTRKAIETVGFMDDKYFLYYEETDWNIRIKNAGFKIIFTPYSKIYHKVSSSTKKISYALEYYYDRNRYYFVMKNCNIINKKFCFLYFRLRLYAKILKYKINNDSKRLKITQYSLYSIRNNIMGELNL